MFFPPHANSPRIHLVKSQFLTLSSPEMAGFYPRAALGVAPGTPPHFRGGVGSFSTPATSPARREVKPSPSWQEIREGGGCGGFLEGGGAELVSAPSPTPSGPPCAHPGGVLGHRPPPGPPKIHSPAARPGTPLFMGPPVMAENPPTPGGGVLGAPPNPNSLSPLPIVGASAPPQIFTCTEAPFSLGGS